MIRVLYTVLNKQTNKHKTLPTGQLKDNSNKKQAKGLDKNFSKETYNKHTKTLKSLIIREHKSKPKRETISHSLGLATSKRTDNN